MVLGLVGGALRGEPRVAELSLNVRVSRSPRLFLSCPLSKLGCMQSCKAIYQ